VVAPGFGADAADLLTLGGTVSADAQLDSSTLLPAPAGPTTTVSRLPAPTVSRSCSCGLLTSVSGNVVGRNFASTNRAACNVRFPVTLSATTALPQDSLHHKASSSRALVVAVCAQIR
jgi:hypothetical protein